MLEGLVGRASVSAEENAVDRSVALLANSVGTKIRFTLASDRGCSTGLGGKDAGSWDTSMPNQDDTNEASSPRRRQNPFEQLKALLLQKIRRGPLMLSEDHILSVILVRRARSSVLGEGLFSDPAWDILLELYAATLGERTLTASELAQATETPFSTTQRWIVALEQRGLVRSMKDPLKADQVRISLTAEGVSKMEHLSNHWGSAFLSIDAGPA